MKSDNSEPSIEISGRRSDRRADHRGVDRPFSPPRDPRDAGRHAGRLGAVPDEPPRGLAHRRRPTPARRARRERSSRPRDFRGGLAGRRLTAVCRSMRAAIATTVEVAPGSSILRTRGKRDPSRLRSRGIRHERSRSVPCARARHAQPARSNVSPRSRTLIRDPRGARGRPRRLRPRRRSADPGPPSAVVIVTACSNTCPVSVLPTALNVPNDTTPVFAWDHVRCEHPRRIEDDERECPGSGPALLWSSTCRRRSVAAR